MARATSTSIRPVVGFDQGVHDGEAQPGPLILRGKNGSNTLDCNSAGMPVPVSLTVI